jgi:hypothetical protein
VRSSFFDRFKFECKYPSASFYIISYQSFASCLSLFSAHLNFIADLVVLLPMSFGFVTIYLGLIYL